MTLPTLEQARKEWYRTLTLLDLHRKNNYWTYGDVAKRAGWTYGWLNLLMNPYHRSNAGRNHPTYPLPLCAELVEAHGLQLVSPDVGDVMGLPDALDNWRKANRYSYHDLAQALGVSDMTLHRWLTCKVPIPMAQLIRLNEFAGYGKLELRGELATQPTNPLKKPRGMGERAQAQVSKHKASLALQPDGTFITSKTPAGLTINPDGTVSWGE